ncbi:MAG: hypothetical protein WD266_06275 [Balneolales bacterium]
MLRFFLGIAFIFFFSGALQAQHQHNDHEEQSATEHEMWMQPFDDGWQLMGMGQVFPLLTWSVPFDEDNPLNRNDLYFTQPTTMVNIQSPNARLVLRTSLSFEGLTIPDGEVTLGGWGEEFIDARHPHTLLHEVMLSYNFWDFAGGAFSISAGKGFATYGTDDPMARPVQKFPTNHHLSQILERWQIQGAYLVGGWGFEASLFGGEEPTGPYDFSNIESFGDSWSARLSRRFGEGFGPMAQWETSVSFARVIEDDLISLYNATIRHSSEYPIGNVYGLVEASMSAPEQRDGYFAVLGEAQLQTSRHQPYYRIEYATRPEYNREGEPGTDDFFRYDHDDPPIGATRWLINSAGYGYTLTGYPLSARPFVEFQHNRIWDERGVTPELLVDNGSYWTISVGFRLFFGGDMDRMGTYGILDPMVMMHAPQANNEHGNGHIHHP